MKPTLNFIKDLIKAEVKIQNPITKEVQPLKSYYISREDNHLYIAGTDRIGWLFNYHWESLVMEDYHHRFRPIIKKLDLEDYELMVDLSQKDNVFFNLKIDHENALPGDIILLDDRTGLIIETGPENWYIALDEDLFPQKITVEEAKTKEVKTLIINPLRSSTL